MGQTEWSTLVESICAERGLSVVLSWDMPQGYETANGLFGFLEEVGSFFPG